MEPLKVLAEAVIDTLKKFSSKNKKRPLTSANLMEAFSAREEILSLFDRRFNVSINKDGQVSSAQGKESADCSLTEAGTTNQSNIESLLEARKVFVKILDGLEPLIRDDHGNRFFELQKEVNECESFLPLCLLGERIADIVAELIDQAVERIDIANDFLLELNKDLYYMERELLTYQVYNRETHQISCDFHDDLLSHTGDMHRAFDLNKSIHDIRSLIVSKLDMISKVIEVKRKSDEVRQLEADNKIVELQNNIVNYKNEIQEVRKKSESLEKEVLLDDLTQINNRRAYDLEIKKNLKHYRRKGNRFSLLLIDVDDFKNVNDGYGHKAGDRCLKEVAQLVKSSLRESDFLARFGGDELIAILHGCDAGSARDVAEKIRDGIEKTRFYYLGEVIRVTTSVGVTEVMPSDSDPGITFVRVDEAMYRAKKGGRNRVHVITDQLPERNIRH